MECSVTITEMCLETIPGLCQALCQVIWGVSPVGETWVPRGHQCQSVLGPYLNLLYDTFCATWRSQRAWASLTLNRCLERSRRRVPQFYSSSSGCNRVRTWNKQENNEQQKSQSQACSRREATKVSSKGFLEDKKQEQTAYILMNQKQYWKTTYYPYSDQKNMEINTSDIRPQNRRVGLAASLLLPSSFVFVRRTRQRGAGLFWGASETTAA